MAVRVAFAILLAALPCIGVFGSRQTAGDASANCCFCSNVAQVLDSCRQDDLNVSKKDLYADMHTLCSSLCPAPASDAACRYGRKRILLAGSGVGSAGTVATNITKGTFQLNATTDNVNISVRLFRLLFLSCQKLKMRAFVSGNRACRSDVATAPVVQCRFCNIVWHKSINSHARSHSVCIVCWPFANTSDAKYQT